MQLWNLTKNCKKKPKKSKVCVMICDDCNYVTITKSGGFLDRGVFIFTS